MHIKGKIEDTVVLVCDPSFEGESIEQGFSVFPNSLIGRLSEIFSFQVLRTLESMPIAYIKGEANELRRMDSYLEEKYGGLVSVEASGIVKTDITDLSTSPSV